ncbi:hypothetical protein CLCAR_4159 [Clostridium carboxidivorans P7]|nr:hypothetical protein CLCAR_4159 [Clostridium carboxidivorans P7]
MVSITLHLNFLYITFLPDYCFILLFLYSKPVHLPLKIL